MSAKKIGASSKLLYIYTTDKKVVDSSYIKLHFYIYKG